VRQKGIFLTRLLGKTPARVVPFLVAALVPASAWPGTELGNARFVQYSNGLHGITFDYPEEWNVIDLGDAVNVVEGGEFIMFRPERLDADATQRTEAMERMERSEDTESRGDVQISFNEDVSFVTPISFERYVRKSNPFAGWKQSAFRGRLAYQARTNGRMVIIVQKDKGTAMHLNYPVDSAGSPSPLVEKTVSTISFKPN